MKIVIIEDEIVAAQQLDRLINQIRPEYTVITALQTIGESVKWFEQNATPDLVFMDIHLADGSSFAIFDKTQIECPVIFTTAYSEHALEAFEVNGIDYLLKPINKERLAQAIVKFEKFGESRADSEIISKLIATIKDKQSQSKSHFLIPYKDRLVPLAVQDIAYVTAEFKIARVVTCNSQSYSIDFSLEELMKQLDSHEFFRANRQYIVAHKAINDLSVWFGGKLSVNLKVPVEERIIVSKAKVPDFKEWYTRGL